MRFTKNSGRIALIIHLRGIAMKLTKNTRGDVLLGGMLAMVAALALYVFTPSTKTQHFVLPSHITATNVTDVTNAVLNATENDRIVLHVNGYGGDIASGYLLLAAIAETKAHIKVDVEGFAISMYAMILEAAKTVEIPDDGVVMFHTVQDGSGALPADDPFVKFMTAQLLREGLFTEREVCSILYGKEIWLSGKDFKKRSADRHPLTSVDCRAEAEQKKKDDAKAAAAEAKRKAETIPFITHHQPVIIVKG